MKEEIKEIDRIIINVKRKLQFSPERRFVELFDKGDIKQLLDCITNLQDYKQRNEKAIEYVEHENFKRNILVGVSTKKYTRDILNNVLNILKGDKDE